MNCSVDYLDASTLLPEQVAEGEQIHKAIVKFFSNVKTNDDKQLNIFKFKQDSNKTGRLTIGFSKQKANYLLKYAKQSVDSVNFKYNPSGEEGKNVAALVEDGDNLLKVAIDVRPIFGVEANVEDSTFNLVAAHRGVSRIFDESDNLVEAVIEHDAMFKRLAKAVTDKSIIYENSRIQVPDRFRDKETEDNLKTLIAILKDKSLANRLEGLSKYIAVGYKSINNLRTRIRVIDGIIQTLPPDSKERQIQLTKVSDFVRQSSYYYHYFSVLEDIFQEMRSMKINANPLDSYERNKLEENLAEYILELGKVEDISLFNAEDVQQVLDKTPEVISNPALLFNYIKEKLKEKTGGKKIDSEEYDLMKEKFDKVIKGSLKENGSIQEQLAIASGEYQLIQLDLKRLHYESVAKVLHPVLVNSLDRFPNEDKAKQVFIDWALDESKFIESLKLGGRDLGFMSYWLAAGINTNEILSQTTALMLKNLNIDISQRTRVNVLKFQESLKLFGWYDKTEEQKQEIHQSYLHRNLVVISTTPVEDDYEGLTTTINVLGKDYRVKVRETVNYLNEWDNVKYHNKKRIFSENKYDIAEEYTKQLLENPFALKDLINSPDEQARILHGNIYTSLITTKGKEYYVKDHVLEALKDPDDAKRLMLLALQSSFFQANIKYESLESANNKLIANNIFDKDGDLVVDLNNIDNTEQRKFIDKTAYGTRMNLKSLRETFRYNPETLYGFSKDGAKKVMVQLTAEFDNQYVFMELTKEGLMNPNNYGIAKYFKYSSAAEFVSLKKSEYNILEGGFTQESATKWNAMQNDKFKKFHFNAIVDLYKESNYHFGEQELLYREIPQVSKFENISNLKSIQRTAEDLKTKEGRERTYENWKEGWVMQNDQIPITNKEGKYVDTEGNELPEGSAPIMGTRKLTYVNGVPIKHIQANFIAPIAIEELETDLSNSILLFNNSSIIFNTYKSNESTLLNLMTLLNGDGALKIDARVMTAVNNQGYPLLDKAMNAVIDPTNRASDNMRNMVNDTIYGESMVDFGILGLSAKKIASGLAGATGFMTLAWNLSTMPSNYLISLINERSVSKGNRFWNEKDFKEGFKIYGKSVIKGHFFKDWASQGPVSDKSLLTQLIIMFDAIQGEFLSPMGVIETLSIAEKMSNSALYATQELVEHANQTQSMLMLMKGYKLPSGISLWDAIQNENKDRKDGELVRMPTELTKELETVFQLRLQGVNRIVHGNYANMDKNNLQRKVIGSLLMIFKKYIYDGFRSRLMSERVDLELSSVEEGYFRAYLKAINQEFVQTIKPNALLGSLMTPEGAKAIFSTFVKTTLGGLDAATFRVASKNEDVKSFLYGMNVSERQMYAALRATYEIGTMMRAGLLAIVAEALSDGLDDDEVIKKKLLAYVNLYARKVEGDLGMFTSFTYMFSGGIPGSITLDQFLRIIKDPFVSYRAIDNTMGLFNQIFGVHAVEEEGIFGYDLNITEQYQKSGKGYEKGDYKLKKKLQKSIFAPYYQILRLLNPEQQLEFMNTIFKNSK